MGMISIAATAPKQTINKVNLPKEIISKGDTLMVYDIYDIRYIKLYYESNKYPSNAKMYIVK